MPTLTKLIVCRYVCYIKTTLLHSKIFSTISDDLGPDYTVNPDLNLNNLIEVHDDEQWWYDYSLDM